MYRVQGVVMDVLRLLLLLLYLKAALLCYAMIMHSMSMIYCTHSMLESTNLAIVIFLATSALHMLTVLTKSLYTANLYVELV